MLYRWLISSLAVVALSTAADGRPGWQALFNGTDLTGWQKRGEGHWTVLPGGILVGQRDPRRNPPTKEWPLDRKTYQSWLDTQAWLYTEKEFEEYDLTLEYWTRVTGNSGISIHDRGRGENAITTPPDFRKTPSKVAYEIQINNRYPDPHPTGSIYGIVDAKTGAQKDDQWNRMDIEVRKAHLRVRLNGVLVAEAATPPDRPTSGPIGLQLHDMYSVSMYRNIKIRPYIRKR